MQASKPKKKELNIKRDKYPYSKHHFYFNANSKDYLLFINDSRGFLVGITEGISKQVAEIQLQPIIPIHFISTGKGDIIILYQNGILTQYVQQLILYKKFVKVQFGHEIAPRKIIKVRENSYIIVSSRQTLIYFEDGKITNELPYPSQMLMQDLQIDILRRQLQQVRLVVPHRKSNFPFVFSDDNISEWKKEKWLQERVKRLCLEEQQILLPAKNYKFCFSSTHNKIFIYYQSQTIVLSTKFQLFDAIHLPFLYFRCKNKWNQIPTFLNANYANGTIILITNDFFNQVAPDRLSRTTDIVVRQKLKDNRLVSHGYGLSNGSCVFISLDSQTTRLLLI